MERSIRSMILYGCFEPVVTVEGFSLLAVLVASKCQDKDIMPSSYS